MAAPPASPTPSFTWAVVCVPPNSEVPAGAWAAAVARATLDWKTAKVLDARRHGADTDSAGVAPTLVLSVGKDAIAFYESPLDVGPRGGRTSFVTANLWILWHLFSPLAHGMRGRYDGNTGTMMGAWLRALFVNGPLYVAALALSVVSRSMARGRWTSPSANVADLRRFVRRRPNPWDSDRLRWMHRLRMTYEAAQQRSANCVVAAQGVGCLVAADFLESLPPGLAPSVVGVGSPLSMCRVFFPRLWRMRSEKGVGFSSLVRLAADPFALNSIGEWPIRVTGTTETIPINSWSMWPAQCGLLAPVRFPLASRSIVLPGGPPPGSPGLGVSPETTTAWTAATYALGVIAGIAYCWLFAVVAWFVAMVVHQFIDTTSLQVVWQWGSIVDEMAYQIALTLDADHGNLARLGAGILFRFTLVVAGIGFLWHFVRLTHARAAEAVDPPSR